MLFELRLLRLSDEDVEDCDDDWLVVGATDMDEDEKEEEEDCDGFPLEDDEDAVAGFFLASSDLERLCCTSPPASLECSRFRCSFLSFVSPPPPRSFDLSRSRDNLGLLLLLLLLLVEVTDECSWPLVLIALTSSDEVLVRLVFSEEAELLR